ncbi:MAG: TolB family protein [Anaerolineales bacterium]
MKIGKLRIISTLIILTISTLLFTACSGGGAYPGAIAYQRVVENDSQIYVMDPAGEVKTRVSEGGGWYFMPSWAQDGEKLAYYFFNPGTQMTSVYAVDVTEVDFEQTLLTDRATYDINFGALKWSPDGKTILYHSVDVLEIADIYTVDVDTGVVKDIFEDTIFYDYSPDWSPDGTQFVFASNRPDRDQPIFDLFIADASGENLVNLTDNNNNGWVDTLPAWSSDGEKIAFWRFNYIEGENFEGGPAGIWLYDLTTQEETLVYEMEDASDETAPVWSPNGKYLAFLEGENDQHTLRVAKIPSGELLDIALVTGDKRAVSWSPDSRALVFSNYADSTIGVYILDVKSGELSEVIESDPEASIGDPHWGGR